MEQFPKITKQKENPALLMMRHLKDIDDLRNSRDASIESGQDTEAIAIAKEVYEDFKQSDSKAILFSVSNRKRTLETARLVKEKLEEFEDGLKIFMSPNEKISDLDHGEYILPDDYKIGDFYQPFKDAWKILTDETFNKNNPNYHFGDSKISENGNYAYPELEGHFTKLGESYKEVCIRLYSSILDLYENKNRFEDAQVRPYVLTHSLPFSIFRLLREVAYSVKFEDYTFEPGTLMKVCWDKYQQKGPADRSYYGQVSEVSMDIVDNEKFIKMLENEVEYLKNKI